MDATLHADLGCAAPPCFGSSARDFVERQVIWGAPEVFVPSAFGEGAKATCVVTNVRVIDVAVDHVANSAAYGLRAHLVGGAADFIHSRVAGGEECRDTARFKTIAARS